MMLKLLFSFKTVVNSWLKLVEGKQLSNWSIRELMNESNHYYECPECSGVEFTIIIQ